jgi:hypothetical protein
VPLWRASMCLGIGGEECIATGRGEYKSGSFRISFSVICSGISSMVAKSEAGIVASDEISGAGICMGACWEDGGKGGSEEWFMGG